MATLERHKNEQARRPRHFEQPESLSRLRPSQARAERNREARDRRSSIEYWLRRLPRAPR